MSPTLCLEDLQFMRTAFGEQTDATNVPKWLHSFEVMYFLATQLTPEIQPQAQKQLLRAALGHDLLEDTALTCAALEKQWGTRTSSWIHDLTKFAADGSDSRDYIHHLAGCNEHVWLVKLADIYCNAQNTIRVYDTVDTVWLDQFWLPLLKQYLDWIEQLTWKKTPLMGKQLSKKTKATILELFQKANKKNTGDTV